MKKKLIEVSLPLEAINKQSAREKSIRHGHPSTLHLWWARRPLAACRAVLFASLVDDPGDDAERERLHKIIERLVDWDNLNDKELYDEARAAIRASAGPDGPPPVYDPFCGGGSISLEAQRLGLEAHASDLNPVAVLITKALIEIPPKFAGQPPINPEAKKKIAVKWPGATGLADDVRYYGRWMRGQADERLGYLYPKVKLEDGSKVTAIAWLWARTVICPNPACAAKMPLIKSFILCSKKGKEVWIRPLVEGKAIRFEIVNKGKPLDPPKIGRGAKFRCLRCGQIASETYIKAQGMASHMGMQLMAMVGEGNRGRVYREPSREHERVAESARPDWEPDQELASDPRNIWCVQYGLSRFQHLFTNRQLTALNTFSDLVAEAQKQLRNDGASPGYAKAVITYLALGVSRLVNRTSTVCFWDQAGENVQQVFARQAIPMTWDFVEGNPLSNSTGNFLGQIDYLSNALESVPAAPSASVEQLDAITACPPSKVLFSTDPPYYDNISYANLSDFFYVWLRKALKDTYPSLFSTLLVPKKQELVAIPYRFKHGRAEAKVFFEGGFNRAFAKMQACQNANYPLTVFYAFKQSEEESEYDGPQVSTGWETMLEGLLRAGFQVTGTWPVRTELTQNLKKAVSALASSIVLVCRPRQESAGVTSRRDFLAALKRELPSALKALQHGNIAPVDLAQAAIGPGMSIFSRYSKVIEMDGTAMRVRTALGLINQALDEVLSEQESDLDADTRFALAWFEERGFESGEYGRAEVLATAKAVSVRGLEESGILTSRAGKVRLLKRSELQDDWDPTEERDLTVWAATQHLIRALEISTAAAAELAAKLGGMAETARELAYRLYTLCDKKGWAEEAGSYNGLVVNWPAIQAQTEEFALRA